MNPIFSLKRIMLVAVLLLLTLTLHTVYGQENPLPETLSVTTPPQFERIVVADVTDNPPAPVLAPEISRGPNAVNTANIEVNYINAAATWDTQPAAKAAFQYAVNIWSTLIHSSTPIVIDAYWENLSVINPGILGAASAITIHANNGSFPYANTWYPAALANARAGYDVNGSSTAEIRARFNSNRSDWYFGTGDITPATQYNFASVVLHEIGHGLGFFGSMFYDNGLGDWECRGISGEGCWGYSPQGSSSIYPVIYDRFTESAGGTSLINTGVYPNPSIQLGLQLTSSNIYFDGAIATATHGSRVPLYAPATWRPGSSYSHLAESFNNTPNALMTYSLSNGETNYHPGPVALAMFKDMGWDVTIPTVYQPPQLAQLPHQLLEMNTVRPNAFYVYDYTILVPGIVYDLSYEVTNGGDPGAGISFDGASISISPQPDWTGKTTATLAVKDLNDPDLQTSSSTFTVVVTDEIYKVHLPTVVK
ncbi:MAG: hypothetical protein R6X34_21355 [Chloroflexota bacterium]